MNPNLSGGLGDTISGGIAISFINDAGQGPFKGSLQGLELLDTRAGQL